MNFRSRSLPLLLLAGSLALGTPALRAQHGGGGGGMHGGGMGGPGMPGGPMGNPGGFGHDFPRDNGGPPPRNAPDSAGTVSGMRGGLQLGPPGRWWDDKHFAKDLKLRPDQQRRMDLVFEQNRANLLRRFQDLEGEEARMESLVRAKSLDEGTLFAEIDRISAAHAELEKANTHYLLQIRNEMDPDQISRLEQHR